MRRNPETCSVCGGLGYEVIARRDSNSVDCWDCGGGGQYRKRCSECSYRTGSQPGQCASCKGVGFFPEHIFPAYSCYDCKAQPGQCGFCRGTGQTKYGHCFSCNTTGVCKPCQGTGVVPEKLVPERECTFCQRTGKCRQCRGQGVKFCSRDEGREASHSCQWCNICPSCQGRGINSRNCYKCKGSGVQDTIEEIRAHLKLQYEQSKIRIRSHLRNYGITEPQVELLAKRQDSRPSIIEMLSDKERYVLPEFYQDIIFAENYPLVDGLFDCSDLLRKHLSEIFDDPAAYSFYTGFWVEVYYQDNLIGHIDTDHRFHYAGDLIGVLQWWALTDIGADKDTLEIDFAGAVRAIHEYTIRGSDTLDGWGDMLKRHTAGFSRYTDGYLSFLNLIRSTANRAFRNRDVEPFNFAH